jgi:hypothetical protein
MIHEEIEQLLGAYALHATGPDERQEIDTHLVDCPRCRAEVQAHFEAAALLGSTSEEAPPGLWAKIAGSISEGTPTRSTDPLAGAFPRDIASLSPSRPRLRRRTALQVTVASAAAAIIAFLGIEVVQLHNELRSLTTAVARSGLAGAAAQVAIGEHQTIALTSVGHSPAATIIVGPSGEAFWVWSSLGVLSSSRTYQLWALARGQVVSLGLVGPNPHSFAGFRVEVGVTEVMVTAEPAGGVPKPTTAVLAAGAVPGTEHNQTS